MQKITHKINQQWKTKKWNTRGACLGFLLATGFTSLYAEETPTLTLSLKDAMAQAKNLNPDLAKAKSKVEESSHLVWSTRGELFPQVQVNSQYNWGKTAIDPSFANFPGLVTTARDTWTTNIEGTQLIFDGGRAIHALRLAGATERGAAIERELAKDNLYVQVMEDYFSLALTREKVKLLQKSLQAEEQFYSDADKRLRSGSSTRYDVLKATAAVGSTKTQLKSAESLAISARGQLADTLGIDPKTDFILTEDIASADDALRVNVDDALKKALERNRELKLAQNADEQLGYSHSATLAAHLPQLYLFGNYGWTGDQARDLFKNNSASYAAGVKLSIPIFSGLSGVFQRWELAEKRAQSSIDVSRKERAMYSQVSTQVEKVQAEKSKIESSGQAVDAAREAAKLARLGFKAGAQTSTEVLQAERDMLDAEIQLLQSRYDYLSASVRLQKLLGENTL